MQMNPKDLATSDPSATDHADSVAAVTRFLESRLETLVDQSIEIAKRNGYAPFTTTIRAAWVEAILSVTESLGTYLAAQPEAAPGPQAALDYRTDPRFARMRQIARRHRSLGITMPMYVGLLKHFRNLYIRELEGLLDGAPGTVTDRVRDFFDETELSISADWHNSDDNVRLRELQERARAITLDKDRYFAIFESLRSPAFLLDKSYNLLNANEAAAETFLGDMVAGEIIYLRLMRQKKNALQEVIDQTIEAMTETDRSVWLSTLKGARCFDVRMRGLHDAVDNTSIGHVMLLSDVTEHRRAAERAEQSERGMSRFLATMSHEIRTPLHSVLGATELLRTADTASAQNYLDLIETAGQTLLQTLSNVLDYSKLANDPPEPRVTTLDLAQVLTTYERIATVGQGRESANLSLEIAGDLPRWVRIDWAMVQQVLSNLISNAIRADDGHGVVVAIQRCSSEAPALRFEVRDHGPGLPEADAEALFKPWEKTKARETGSGGAGLGLAIAHHLVEAMRGRIGYRNHDTGAVVWFEIPFDPAEAPGPDPVAAPQRASATLAARQRCLLVDDDPIGSTVTTRQLERLGFAVTHAGTLAAARAATAQGGFDVYVVDYTLPDGDGPSLVRALRDRLPAGPRYVALTANVEALERSETLRHLFDGILAKPVDQATLASALNTAPQPCTSPAASAAQASLEGLSPETVTAMLQAFEAAWEAFRQDLRAARAGGPSPDLAPQAHRLAGSTAILGLCELEAPLRALEQRWPEHTQPEEVAPMLTTLDRDLSQVPSWLALTARAEAR
ncbi:ATP-binding protein [Dinoroseobacter sp. S76]|uniref:ATP-binding protein n=1 Tax=Dinoroseobacter sp. S76 TaxID=3415124 RepID=UPI003C7DB234